MYKKGKVKYICSACAFAGIRTAGISENMLEMCSGNAVEIIVGQTSNQQQSNRSNIHRVVEERQP